MKEDFQSHHTPREAVSRAWNLRVGLGGGTEGARALARQRERRQGGSLLSKESIPRNRLTPRATAATEAPAKQNRKRGSRGFRPKLRLKALGSSAPAPPDPPLPPRASLSRHSGQKTSRFFKGHARFPTKGPASPRRSFKVYFTILQAVRYKYNGTDDWTPGPSWTPTTQLTRSRQDPVPNQPN